MEIPRISILTPTYDRKKFLPLMICNIENFDYPKELITWEILDSFSFKGKRAEKLFKSENEIKALEKQLNIKIKYKYVEKTMSIGQKRNYLSKHSTEKIMINMDSDDIYLPTYLIYSTHLLKTNNANLTGSNSMLFYDGSKFYAIQCEAKRQIHEATMCYTKKHWKSSNGYSNSSQGEGAGMIDNFNENKIINGEIIHMMICVVHNNNTIDKNKFLTDKMIFEINKDEIPPPQIEMVKNLLSKSNK